MTTVSLKITMKNGSTIIADADTWELSNWDDKSTLYCTAFGQTLYLPTEDISKIELNEVVVTRTYYANDEHFEETIGKLPLPEAGSYNMPYASPYSGDVINLPSETYKKVGTSHYETVGDEQLYVDYRTFMNFKEFEAHCVKITKNWVKHEWNR